MTEPITLRAAVFRNLDNAIANGYHEMKTMPPEDAAADLATCASDMEDVPMEELIRYVAEWQRARTFG